MRNLVIPIVAAAMIASTAVYAVSCSTKTVAEDIAPQPTDRVVVAYVTSWSNVVPDPHHMTHINYAFGHVTDTYDGLRIDNLLRLKAIVGLKDLNPELKVLLSVGGWGSGGFSEMAADSVKRCSFAASCRKAVDEYYLDGIDIDWEYPTCQGAGISCSPDDTANFTLLMRDLRDVIGSDKLLTIASVSTAKYIDLPAVLPYLDFVNVMSYDMGDPPHLHNALYRSELAGMLTVSESVERHLAAGVPNDKLVMGMPLYGRGDRQVWSDSDVVVKWDDVALVPYAEKGGAIVLSFDNVESIGHKCQYILDQGLRGGMYWEYGSEPDEDHPMAVRIKQMLLE